MSIEKVAILAGVSTATVSRVINNRTNVAEATVRAVRKAMAEVGYTPSDRRPGPRPAPEKRAMGTLGFFVVGRSGGPESLGFMELLRGVSEGSVAHGCEFVYEFVADHAQLEARVRRHGCAGILLHSESTVVPEQSPLRELPCVWLMGSRHRRTWGDQVLPDIFEIGSSAAEKLRAAGHERVAYINLDAGHWWLRQCGHAFLDAAEQIGLHAYLVSRPRGQASAYLGESASTALDEVLALSPCPTAACVAEGNQLAALQSALARRRGELGEVKLQLLAATRERNSSPSTSAMTAPTEVDFHAIGLQGVEQLVWRISQDANPSIVTRFLAPDRIVSGPST